LRIVYNKNVNVRNSKIHNQEWSEASETWTWQQLLDAWGAFTSLEQRNPARSTP
jgi:hypothetical protein